MKKVIFLLVALCICFVALLSKDDDANMIVIQQIEYAEFVSLFKTDAEFILTTSKEQCPYCKEFYNNLNNMTYTRHVSIYIIDVEKLSQLEKEWIDKIFENNNRVPHSYKIKNGEIIDDYIGYNGTDHFKQWLSLKEEL